MIDIPEVKKLAYSGAVQFRKKYKLGNYCGNQLISILQLLEEDIKRAIKLIRTPFKNYKLAGFIGYKNQSFVIVTNTNKTLGNERFTIAHEIYHLLTNQTYIEDNTVMEESSLIIEGVEDSRDINEIMANAFAAELLMPKNDIEENVFKFTENRKKDLDIFTIIKLQHLYGVDYKAVTKRLIEINFIDEKQQKELEEILKVPGELEKLTLNLGYSNELNIPSTKKELLQKDLQILKENFDNNYTTYDDLVRIFGYLGTTPEEFGYDDEVDLSQEALQFIKGLTSK